MQFPTQTKKKKKEDEIDGEPVLFDAAEPIREGEDIRAILDEVPWKPRPEQLRRDWDAKIEVPKVTELRLVLEVTNDHDTGTDIVARRQDHPLSFVKSDRQFRERLVRTEHTDAPIQRWIAENTPKEATA